jgi:hypothetical protein
MSKIIDILFPLWKVNKYIDGKIKEIDNDYSVDIPTSVDKEKYIEILEKELKAQLERKKGIEDKAKSILFAITLTVTILIFSINSLKLSYDNWFDYIPLFILIVSVFCLIISACLSLKALELKEYSYLFVVKNDDNAKNIELIIKEDETALIDAIKTKTLNDFRITKIGNYVSIAYSSIRNGIIGFALVLIILMLHSFFNPPQKASPLPLKGTIETSINDSTTIKSNINLNFKD